MLISLAFLGVAAAYQPARGAIDLQGGGLPDDAAVVLRYSEEETSLRDPEAVRAAAARLQNRVDHPDFAEWSRHMRLLESRDVSSSRLVYGGPRAVYHLTSMSNGLSWERGATDRERWSFFNHAGSDEPAGDLVIVQTGKPVPVHRDVSKMIEDSERVASLFLRSGLPRSAVPVSEEAASRTKVYESRPLGRRYRLVYRANGSDIVSSVDVSLLGQPETIVERIEFSSEVIGLGDGITVHRTVAVEDVQQQVRTTYRIDHAERIERSRAEALASVPTAEHFGTGGGVRTLDFSQSSTLRDPEYTGVPTVTWTVRPDGRDEFAYDGLPITPTPVDPGLANSEAQNIGGERSGFVVSRFAVAGIAIAIGFIVFGVFAVKKERSSV